MAYVDQPDNGAGFSPAPGAYPYEQAVPRHAAGAAQPVVRPDATPPWPLLADDFFRLTHDDSTGKPWLNARDLGVGLAAALLGELTAARKVEPRAGILETYPGAQAPPSDALAHTVLDRILKDPQLHDLRAWLIALGLDAHEQVAGRLLRAGHVERTGVRRRWRADEVRYVPVDRSTAAMPWARLSLRLRNRQTLHTFDVFLAGLVSATGLASHVLDGAPRDAAVYLADLVDQLPGPLRELVAYTEVVVGEAVLGRRT